MSSILRALKKVEADSAAREGRDGAKKVSEKHPPRQERGSAGKMYRNLFFAAAALLAIAAAWIFFTAVKTPPAAKEPVDSPGKPAAAVSTSQSPTLQKEPQESTQDTSGESVQQTPTPGIAAKPGQPAPKPGQSSPPGAAVESGTTSSKPAAAGSRQSPQPKYILKGILWSDNPARRVALINDSYLKEGDKIDGVELLRIARDQVILKSGEKEWAVKVQK